MSDTRASHDGSLLCDGIYSAPRCNHLFVYVYYYAVMQLAVVLGDFTGQ